MKNKQTRNTTSVTYGAGASAVNTRNETFKFTFVSLSICFCFFRRMKRAQTLFFLFLKGLPIIRLQSIQLECDSLGPWRWPNRVETGFNLFPFLFCIFELSGPRKKPIDVVVVNKNERHYICFKRKPNSTEMHFERKKLDKPPNRITTISRRAFA